MTESRTTGSGTPLAPRVGARRGFTLMEIMVAVAVIAILIAILIVGIRHVRSIAVLRASEQSVNAIKMGVEQFKTDFGFFPPLVKDMTPLKAGASGMVPDVYLESVPADVQFLRNRTGSTPTPPSTAATPDLRFSVYSIAYYVMGALPMSVDGVEGNGFRQPQRDGSFQLVGGKTYGALFDPRRGGGLNPVDPVSGRIELLDRNGNPFRYYLWLPGIDPTGVIETPEDRNVPSLIGNAFTSTDLRSAQWAVVSAGANGVFGDLGSETVAQIEDGTRQPAGTATNVLESKARQDNVIAVGG